MKHVPYLKQPVIKPQYLKQVHTSGTSKTFIKVVVNCSRIRKFREGKIVVTRLGKNMLSKSKRTIIRHSCKGEIVIGTWKLIPHAKKVITLDPKAICCGKIKRMRGRKRYITRVGTNILSKGKKKVKPFVPYRHVIIRTLIRLKDYIKKRQYKKAFIYLKQLIWKSNK